MRAVQPDYYTILQVDPRAEPEIIQVAYRRLAAKHHPDVDPSPEALERMKLLNDAYEVLSDPVKRREHDTLRLRGQQQTIENPSTKHIIPWRRFLVPAMIILLLLLRFNVRLLLLAAPIFLLLWLLMNWQPQRK